MGHRTVAFCLAGAIVGFGGVACLIVAIVKPAF